MSIILDGLEKAQKKERLYIPRPRVPAKEKRKISPHDRRYKYVLYILCAAVVTAAATGGLFYENIRYKTKPESLDSPNIVRNQSALSRAVYPGPHADDVPPARSAQADSPPTVSVTGILWDEEAPMVLVNNKILKKGDIVSGAEIVSIGQDTVCFLYKGKKFEVSVE